MANVDAIVSMTSPLEQLLKLKRQADQLLDGDSLTAIGDFVALSRAIMQDLEQDKSEAAARVGAHFEEMARRKSGCRGRTPGRQPV